MDIVEGKIILPNTQKIINELSHQPTEAERISVLEEALTDLAIMLTGGTYNG